MSEKKKQQTLQQKRADFSLTEISKIADQNKGLISKDLANFIVGMPAMILTNGIGQTFVFLLSKKPKDPKSPKDKEKKYEITFDIMKKWITIKMPSVFTNTGNNIEFLKKFNTISQSEYLEIQREELRLLEWLKRYARALEDKSQDKDNGE